MIVANYSKEAKSMIGDAVRAMRKDRGWTQADLARESGLGQGSITGIERGKTPNPTQVTLIRLAKAFGVTVDELLARSVGTLPPAIDQLRSEGVPGEALLRLSNMWSDLTEEDREVVISVTRTIWERRTNQRIEGIFGPKSIVEGER